MINNNMLFEKDSNGNYTKINLDFFTTNRTITTSSDIKKVTILNKELELDLTMTCVIVNGNMYLSINELSQIFNCSSHTITAIIRNILGNYLKDINLFMINDLRYHSLRKNLNPTYSVCFAEGFGFDKVHLFNIILIKEIANHVKNEVSTKIIKYYDLLFIDSLYVMLNRETKKNNVTNTYRETKKDNVTDTIGYMLNNGKPDIENFKNSVNEILSKRRSDNIKIAPMNGFVPFTNNTIGRGNVSPIYGVSSNQIHIDDVDNCCENCQNSDDDHLYDENHFNEEDLVLNKYDTVHQGNKNIDWNKLEKNIVDYKKQLDDYKNNMDKLYSDLKNEFCFLKNEFYF